MYTYRNFYISAFSLQPITSTLSLSQLKVLFYVYWSYYATQHPDSMYTALVESFSGENAHRISSEYAVFSCSFSLPTKRGAMVYGLYAIRNRADQKHSPVTKVLFRPNLGTSSRSRFGMVLPSILLRLDKSACREEA